MVIVAITLPVAVLIRRGGFVTVPVTVAVMGFAFRYVRMDHLLAAETVDSITH